MAFPDGWGRRCEIQVGASLADSNLSYFPLLLTRDTLPSEMMDADGSYPALNGGGDIRFSSDSDGTTRLPCEIVTFVTDNNPANAQVEIYVRVPTISSSATTSIWVWYNKTGETQPAEDATYGKEETWDENGANNYLMVQHLNEDPSGTSPQAVDSTSNDNDGTSIGTMTSGDKVTGAQDGGTEGDAWDTDGTDDAITCGTFDINASACTISCWFYMHDGLPYHDARLVSKADGTAVSNHWWMLSLYDAGAEASDTLRMRLKTSGTTTTLNGSDAALSMNTWYMGTARYTGSQMQLYKDGAGTSLGSVAKSGAIDTNNTKQVAIGVNPPSGNYYRWFDGLIDEVRISKVSRSNAWLNAEYRNMNAPATYVTEQTPELVPYAISPSAQRNWATVGFPNF